MSQPSVKNEVTVKKEGEETVRGSPPSSSSSMNTPDADNDAWQEIPLKCCTQEETKDIRFHMMKFQSTKDVDIVNNFTKPVRLHRKDPRNIQFHLTREEIDVRKKEQQERKENGEEPSFANSNGMDMSQVAPDGGARKQKKNLFKRKTRQINLMDDEKRKLRYEEYYPWVIEDYDGRNVFVGNYEAGSSDTQHVLFVFDTDGFKMIPAEKVYRFTPRNKYATLTLEEAEAKMEKNSSVPRWLMKHMEDRTPTDSPDQRFKNHGPSNGNVAKAPTSGRRLKTVTGGASFNDRDSDHDDLDFDEEFADDEEAPIMDGDDEENKLSEKKIKKEMLKAAHFDGQSDVDDDLDDLFETETRKVDKEGKKLKKVLNKAEGGVYDSDDEDNLNPYLSKSDLESDDDDSEPEISVKNEPTDGVPTDTVHHRSIFAHNIGDGVIIVKGPKDFLNGFPRGNWNPTGRRLPTLAEATKQASESPARASGAENRNLSPTPTPASIGDLNSSGEDNNLVTVSEVLALVKDNPLTTKELLLRLKSKVSAHRDNKQRIISIVKQNLKLVDGKLVSKEV